MTEFLCQIEILLLNIGVGSTWVMFARLFFLFDLDVF